MALLSLSKQASCIQPLSAAAQSQLFEVQRELEEVRTDLRAAQFAAEEAHIEASQRTADAQAAGRKAAAESAAREAEANTKGCTILTDIFSISIA
eukprot:scaffold5894_cov19-Tisochrysis_lutea.AAC.1